MTKQEFDKLMLRMQQGDEQAFEIIYNETRRGLFAFVLSICKNYHTAEDMLQTAYIRLRTTVASYRAGGNAYAWLYTIAKNATLNEINRAKRETSVDVDEDVSVFGSYLMDESADTSVTIVMNRVLNDYERQVVTLHAVTGFKHREIAEMLEKPLGSILWTYNNALGKLKRAMEKEGNVDET